MNAEPPAEAPPANLFTPRFGYSPHQIVGRDTLLNELASALRSPRGTKHSTTLVMGPRGAGKTVMLNAAEAQAAELGYAIVSVDAATPGVHERIVSRIERIADALPALEAGAEADEVRTSAGLRLGPFRASRERRITTARTPNARDALESLADTVAASGGTGVLLTIDEMHRVDVDEMIRLANDLQHVSSRNEAPVVFVGASLPDIKNVLNDDRMSFFRRCADEDLAGLDAADAYAFIGGTVKDAGGDYDQEALRRLTETVGPLPYEMQLLGDYAWRFAGAPLRPIGDEAVGMALRATADEMRRKVYAPLWERLSGDERSVLIAVTDNDGSIARGELGQMLSGSVSDLDLIVRRLEHKACIACDDPDLLSLGPALSLAAARHETQISTAYHSGSGFVARSGASLPRCGKPMPRAKKRCVLRRGHRGGCRSQI